MHSQDKLVHTVRPNSHIHLSYSKIKPKYNLHYYFHMENICFELFIFVVHLKSLSPYGAIFKEMAVTIT